MADIIIPGINKVLLDGTIVILNGFDDVKYILHNGFYMYNSEVFEGWYGVSIPEQNVIPLAPQMLIGCEVIYYPNSNCECRFPSGNIPFTTEDEYQVQRSFITVDTMDDRDKLSPNMSITDIPNGRIVRVNKPNNLDFEPKYYVYRHNQDLTEAYWEEYNIYIIPADGIPKSDLSDDIQASLDKADTALQKLPVYVVDWLNATSDGGYNTEAINHNIHVLQSIYNKPRTDYILYISYNNILYNASFGAQIYPSAKYAVHTTIYLDQTEQVNRLNIYSSDTVESYRQDLDYTVNQGTFDPTDSVAPATQLETAVYIRTVADAKGAAQAVQNNLDIVSNTVSRLSGDVSQIKSNISDINAVIPNQASAQNQLADKDFVNSTVATNTAYFRGTYDSVAALEAYSGPLTNNDYAFVVQYDTVKPEQIVSYSRYKYNSQTEQWSYEYTLNNSSFTAEQWATINSGMTAELVTSVRGHIANATIHVTAEDKTTWNSKYAKPTAGIPSTDMTDEVQASLHNADTALQEVPIASEDTLGGVKIGEGINVDQTGIISVDGSSVYIIPSNAASATISDTLSNMTADYESGKPVSAYIALPSSPCKQIPAMVTWYYNTNSDYTKTVFAIYIDGIDFKHTSSHSQHEYDEIPYYYHIRCLLSDTTWRVSAYQGNYAQSTIDGDEVSTNSPEQYAIVNKRAVINYVKSKEYTLPTASASTLGGVKIGTNISIDDNGVISADSGISDTGWQHIGLITSSQIGALQGAWAYEAPVDSAFAYRIINGNHVYIAGGFRVISAPPFDTILSATLPDSIRPRRLVPDGSGGFNWSVGNVRFNCATATSNVNVELSIEQGANVIRWRGISGDTKTDMVSVMFDYYVS